MILYQLLTSFMLIFYTFCIQMLKNCCRAMYNFVLNIYFFHFWKIDLFKKFRGAIFQLFAVIPQKRSDEIPQNLKKLKAYVLPNQAHLKLGLFCFMTKEGGFWKKGGLLQFSMLNIFLSLKIEPSWSLQTYRKS